MFRGIEREPNARSGDFARMVASLETGSSFMAETKLEKSSSDQSSEVADNLTRRELLKRGGKIAAAAAVSSVFSPFFIHSARAATKTLSFWQFYAPNGISNLQSKW